MTHDEAVRLASETPGASVAQVKRGLTPEGKETLFIDMPGGDWELVGAQDGLRLQEGDFCVVRPIERG